MTDTQTLGQRLKARRLEFKTWLAQVCRSWSTKLDGNHLLVIPECPNSDTLVGYLTAMAHKKGFKAWSKVQ